MGDVWLEWIPHTVMTTRAPAMQIKRASIRTSLNDYISVFYVRPVRPVRPIRPVRPV